MSLQEDFKKVDGHILRHDVKEYEGSTDGVRKYNSYTRTFNFLSRQVTTIHRDWLFESRGSSAAGTSAIATHEKTENFDDLASDAEVKFMHKKLVELGGTPPSLEEVLPNSLGKKSSGLRSLSRPEG